MNFHVQSVGYKPSKVSSIRHVATYPDKINLSQKI